MDYNQSFAISAAGMSFERTRIEVASLNLANANTIQAPDGVNYRPMQAVARSVGVSSLKFSQILNTGLRTISSDEVNAAGSLVSIEPTDLPVRQAYEPGHPMANERGFVNYTGVDSAAEMMTIMSAMRSYEANVAAMNASRSMALKTLDIGG